ncbi:BnaA01g29010D [Brassica napus]|uniref:BnaA01g29010D protein n=1 Tax=Brassica napus TaxID=3708 RepID=A0A078G427_BRANA|nr:BnaA01g29010D [Brassica napus]
MEMVKRSKKQDEINVNDPFMTLQNDMNVEILMKLPPGSIARLHFASKHLSSIILGKEFTELYKTRSSTQPRHLVSVHGGHPYVWMHRFHSISQEYPSSNHDKVSCSVDPYGPCLATYDFTPPVRGLIFGRHCSNMVVGNPGTVNDVYKVLCMTVVTKHTPCVAMSEVHQVITVGAKEKWRRVECKYPYHHYPGYQEICRDGVIYYLASYKGKKSLMRFDLSSEDFNVTKLPEDQKLQRFGEMVNHTGKITVATTLLGCIDPVDLWVLEDVNKEVWSKTVVVVPSLPERFGMSYEFVFKGILGTGEMIFAPRTTPSPSPNPFFFLCYNPEGGKFRKIEIDELVDYPVFIQVFVDHVESYMVLSRVC